MTSQDGRRGFSNWLAGLVVGVAAGVLALLLPVVGYAIALIFALLMIRATPRLPAFGGLFLGLGASSLTLLIRAHLDCQAFNLTPGQGCLEPDIGPLLAVGAVLLAIGVLTTVVGLTRLIRRT